MNQQDLERAEAEMAGMLPQFVSASTEMQSALSLLEAAYKAHKAIPENTDLRRRFFQRMREASDATMAWGSLARKHVDLVEPVLDWMAKEGIQ